MRLFCLSLTLGVLLLSKTMDAQITNLGNFNLSSNSTFYSTSKIRIGNRLFFVGPFDENNGKGIFVRDIWMSDGTVSGTKALNIRDLHGITMQRDRKSVV